MELGLIPILEQRELITNQDMGVHRKPKGGGFGPVTANFCERPEAKPRPDGARLVAASPRASTP